jgi:hypothetical protein
MRVFGRGLVINHVHYFDIMRIAFKHGNAFIRAWDEMP